MNEQHSAGSTDEHLPTYANEAAYPKPRVERLSQQQRELTVLPEQWGLTKRELFAAMAMQGILTRGTMGTEQSRAENAVSHADALLKELAK